MSDVTQRRCHQCNRSVLVSDIQTCASCDMVYYCTDTCCENDKRNHESYCLKMIYYKQLTPQLLSHPFTFSGEIGSELFDDQSLVGFLKREGVFNLGLWIRETPLSMQPSCLPIYGELETDVDPYVLPLEGLELENFSIAPPSVALDSWSEYYRWRGIALSSPIALLLQHVMTVYHIIQMSGLAHKPTLAIILAGVEKEADLLFTFKELSALIPEQIISIVMVGPLISANTSGTCFRHSSLSVSRYCMTLQAYLEHQDSPCHIDLVICLNAGLSAYSAWKDAIIEVTNRRMRCYITDYCLLSLDMSQQALNSLIPHLHTDLTRLNISKTTNSDNEQPTPNFNSVRLSEPIINPFRDAKRIYCESARFPWFSNAFICELLFS